MTASGLSFLGFPDRKPLLEALLPPEQQGILVGVVQGVLQGADQGLVGNDEGVSIHAAVEKRFGRWLKTKHGVPNDMKQQGTLNPLMGCQVTHLSQSST